MAAESAAVMVDKKAFETAEWSGVEMAASSVAQSAEVKGLK
jgi:hypothetical protein